MHLKLKYELVYYKYQNGIYLNLQAYIDAVNAAKPAVNVAALVGHTAIRNNHMDQLDRAATAAEITQMQQQLRQALLDGALGLSTGLAYKNAFEASIAETQALGTVLDECGGIYTTHLRTEFDGILNAIDEAANLIRILFLI